MSDRSSPHRYGNLVRNRISTMQRVSQAHDRCTDAHRLRSEPDPRFLAAVAHRLAAAAGIPVELARKRVEQMAISAKPRPSSGGLQDRGR
jgi:hypothetical protein